MRCTLVTGADMSADEGRGCGCVSEWAGRGIGRGSARRFIHVNSIFNKTIHHALSNRPKILSPAVNASRSLRSRAKLSGVRLAAFLLCSRKSDES